MSDSSPNSSPNETRSAHVLLIDPDPLSGQMLTDTLRHWGHQVSLGQGAALTEQALLARSDLLLLDPGGAAGRGWPRLRRLRELSSSLPIIVMLAGDDVFDRVLAFESGADAVIAKPVDMRELRARMLGLLARNGNAGGTSGALQFGRWRLDAVTRRLSGPGGFSTPLSLAEYRVLRAFLERPQSVLRRQELMDLARGTGTESTLERSVDLLISRLRHKLDDDARAPRLIRTVRGIGYLFDDVSERKPRG